MLAPSLSNFGPLGVREFEVFDLPYLFANKETLYRTMDGEVGGAFSPSSNTAASPAWRSGAMASSR